MTSSRPAALIVEDQPFVGMVASDILRESGFETFHAYDARDAEQILQAHPEIEVIVTEAQLPGDMDGRELCRRVRDQRPHVQIIVTASTPEVAAAKIPTGARMLRKPYSSGELRTVVAARQVVATV
jgi:CheY-like chemotaxis protein